MRLPRSRAFFVGLALASLLVVLLANAHLVYVAVRSQPACVKHAKEPARDSMPAAFRAARSSC